MIFEVRRRAVRDVPVDEAVGAAAERVDLRFEAARVAIERVDGDEVGIVGADREEELRDGLRAVDASEAGCVEAERDVRRDGAREADDARFGRASTGR